MSETEGRPHRASWAYFLILALAFGALAFWNGSTGSVGVGIAFAVLGVALAILTLLRSRDERRRGQ